MKDIWKLLEQAQEGSLKDQLHALKIKGYPLQKSTMSPDEQALQEQHEREMQELFKKIAEQKIVLGKDEWEN